MDQTMATNLIGANSNIYNIGEVAQSDIESKLFASNNNGNGF